MHTRCRICSYDFVVRRASPVMFARRSRVIIRSEIGIMFNASTELPINSVALEHMVLQDKLRCTASGPRGFLAALASSLRTVPALVRLRAGTALVAKHYVEDASAESAKETYKGIVKLCDLVREGESLADGHVVFLPTKIFLKHQRESLEDTIESWEMAMDSNFRDLIHSRLKEVSEVKDEPTDRQSDVSLHQ